MVVAESPTEPALPTETTSSTFRVTGRRQTLQSLGELPLVQGNGGSGQNVRIVDLPGSSRRSLAGLRGIWRHHMTSQSSLRRFPNSAWDCQGRNYVASGYMGGHPQH